MRPNPKQVIAGATARQVRRLLQETTDLSPGWNLESVQRILWLGPRRAKEPLLELERMGLVDRYQKRPFR